MLLSGAEPGGSSRMDVNAVSSQLHELKRLRAKLEESNAEIQEFLEEEVPPAHYLSLRILSLT
jgi:hypothetical protein